MAAALTPIIALVGMGIGILSYLLARRKRMDDLFNRRYEFYKRVRDWWLSTGTGAPSDRNPDIDLEDLIPIAEEAGFLFGDDIAQHILSLDKAGHSGSPFFPNEDFSKPFGRYLRL